MDHITTMETSVDSLERKRLARASKRYSFSFSGFKRTPSTTLKRSISISSPTLLDDQQQQELPLVLTNSIYNNQGFNDKKRNSYALCQSLEQSLNQSSSTVTLGNGQILIIPSLVTNCCEYILSHEPLEGLFRVNASIKKIKRLEQLINERLMDHQDFKFEEFVGVEEVEDINSYDVSMILKRYLNNLNDFLVDHDNYSKFARNHESLKTELTDNPSSQSMSSPSSHHSVMTAPNSQFSLESTTSLSTALTENEKQLDENKTNIQTALKTDAKDLFQNTLSPKLHLLTYLLNFLHKLTTSEEIMAKTKMSSLNLSKIFQPSLFEFKVEKQSSTENLLDFYKINEMILWRWIDNFEFLDNCLLQEITTNTAQSMDLTLCTPIKSPLPSALPPVETESAHMSNPISHPKIREASNESVASSTKEEKKQRRRTIFGYRSLSTPNSSVSSSIPEPKTSRVTSANNETKKFTLKRLPTTIFGSSYSLKSILNSQTLLPRSTIQTPSLRNTHLPDADSIQTKERKRMSFAGVEFQRENSEEQGSILEVHDHQLGLQRKPIFAHDIKFNQSPFNSPEIEQSAAF